MSSIKDHPVYTLHHVFSRLATSNGRQTTIHTQSSLRNSTISRDRLETMAPQAPQQWSIESPPGQPVETLLRYGIKLLAKDENPPPLKDHCVNLKVQGDWWECRDPKDNTFYRWCRFREGGSWQLRPDPTELFDGKKTVRPRLGDPVEDIAGSFRPRYWWHDEAGGYACRVKSSKCKPHLWSRTKEPHHIHVWDAEKQQWKCDGPVIASRHGHCKCKLRYT